MMKTILGNPYFPRFQGGKGIKKILDLHNRHKDPTTSAALIRTFQAAFHIRFIFALYPALTAAIVMNPIWKAAWNVRIKAALVVGSLCLLCKSNIFYFYLQPWDVGKYGISGRAYIIIQSVIFLLCCAVIFTMRKEIKTDDTDAIRHFRFLILFTAVFFLGSVCIYIAGLLVLAALVYGLRDTWSVIRQISGKNVSSEDQVPEKQLSSGNFSG